MDLYPAFAENLHFLTVCCQDAAKHVFRCEPSFKTSFSQQQILIQQLGWKYHIKD